MLTTLTFGARHIVERSSSMISSGARKIHASHLRTVGPCSAIEIDHISIIQRFQGRDAIAGGDWHLK